MEEEARRRAEFHRMRFWANALLWLAAAVFVVSINGTLVGGLVVHALSLLF